MSLPLLVLALLLTQGACSNDSPENPVVEVRVFEIIQVKGHEQGILTPVRVKRTLSSSVEGKEEAAVATAVEALLAHVPSGGADLNLVDHCVSGQFVASVKVKSSSVSVVLGRKGKPIPSSCDLTAYGHELLRQQLGYTVARAVEDLAADRTIYVEDDMETWDPIRLDGKFLLQK